MTRHQLKRLQKELHPKDKQDEGWGKIFNYLSLLTEKDTPNEAETSTVLSPYNKPILNHHRRPVEFAEDINITEFDRTKIWQVFTLETLNIYFVKLFLAT